MKNRQTFTNLQTIISLSDPDFHDTNLPLTKIAIKSRQMRIKKLILCGYANEEIANKIGCSLSTVEKDLHEIRELSRLWFEKESIKDFCQSLQDSIILCDNAIEDLQILLDESCGPDKIKIFSKILEFEERKTYLFGKTHAVQKFIRGLR